MKSAFDFQLEVLALVNPLPRDATTQQAVELLLHTYQEGLLEAALSHDHPEVREGYVAWLRHRLIEGLEDLHEIDQPEIR